MQVALQPVPESPAHVEAYSVMDLVIPLERDAIYNCDCSQRMTIAFAWKTFASVGAVSVLKLNVCLVVVLLQQKYIIMLIRD